jgi:choline transport protein
MIITFCFSISSIDDVMNSPTGMAIIDVTYSATGSFAGTCVLITLLLVLYFFGTCNVIAAASRQGWAFARYELPTPSHVLDH